MKRPKVKNSEINKLGERLVRASRISAAEAERVVEDPALYGRVLKRILDEGPADRPAKAFGWQVPAVCSALVAAVSGAYLLAPEMNDRVGSEPVPTVHLPRTEAIAAVLNAEPIEASVSTEMSARTISRRPVRKTAPKAEEAPVMEQAPEFFEIGFAGGLAEAAMDGRVVRVELPRSALFAMGVNVPLENGPGALTAELLVGPDGAPRAIRLVE